MIPIDQTISGSAEGNCFAAAVASVLEVSLEDLPPLNDARQVPDLNRWLALNRPGLQFTWVHFSTYIGSAPGFYLAAGISPRGISHAIVVDQDGTMVHDPHPSKAGISPACLTRLGIFIATMSPAREIHLQTPMVCITVPQ